VGATKEAAKGIVRAHIDLAKAEGAEIGGEIARSAGLGCLAAAALLFVGLLLPIGMTLFFGEWLFGSMGWGILLGTLFWIGIAVTAVLVALRVTGVQWSLAAALLIATMLAILFAFRLPREAWLRLADAVGLNLGNATPVVVGAVVIGIVGAIVGLLAGSRQSGGAAFGGLIAGLVLGAILGAFSAILFDRKGGAATGIAIGLVCWPILMLMRLAQVGVNADDLKQRYYPDVTIETAKETWQWVRQRMPLGPKS
jgi:hypothetical protein